MGSQNRKLRTLTIQFHVTDEELADIHGQFDALWTGCVRGHRPFRARDQSHSHGERPVAVASNTSPKRITSSR